MLRWMVGLGLLLAPTLAHADWYEASTPHFIVYANDSADHIKAYASRLERFDGALRVFRGITDRPITRSERVTVYVVQGDSEIERLYGGSGWGVRGFYRASVTGPEAFVPRRSGSGGKWDLDADSVLQHEYAHHFMFDNYENLALPKWFVEGFAEFHATAIIKDDGSVMFGQAPAYRAYAVLEGNALTIEQMLNADKQKLDGAELDALYGKGWLLIHYLTFEPSRKGQLTAYLRELNSGKRAADAAKVFGDLRALDRELGHYALRPKITVYTVGANAINVQAATIRKLSDGEAAMMPIRIRSKAGVTDRTAPALFSRASKTAASYPGDAGVQLVLAETACDARDYDACLAAANRAIGAEPHNEKAYVFQGRALMSAARRATTPNVAAFRAARKSFVAANRIDADEPEALALYYRSFVEGGEQPTENARAALRKALDFAPEDGDLRFEVAIDFLRAGENAQARTTLLPIAYSPHGGEEVTIATMLVTAIDNGDKDAITRFLHPPTKDDGKDKPAK